MNENHHRVNCLKINGPIIDIHRFHHSFFNGVYQASDVHCRRMSGPLLEICSLLLTAIRPWLWAFQHGVWTGPTRADMCRHKVSADFHIKNMRQRSVLERPSTIDDRNFLIILYALIHPFIHSFIYLWVHCFYMLHKLSELSIRSVWTYLMVDLTQNTTWA